MKIELWSITPDSELLIERCGRVCWRTELSDEGPQDFIRKLIRKGHESVIEHAKATFYVEGVSRACSHQIVRHRIASYSQESQRYVDMSNPEWSVPPTILKSDKAFDIFCNFLNNAVDTYKSLRELDIPKEDARFTLPNATATTIVITMNFRELRHFFKVRCDRHAQWEIRKMAKGMLEIMYNNAPSVFEDLYREFCQWPKRS